MIRIRSEVVAITKTNLSDGVNSDNINLNGKVLEPEIADRGYKGAGNFNGDIIIAAAHGDKETRIATVAMRELEKHRIALKTAGDDYMRQFDEFFNDITKTISLSGGAPEQFDATLMYVFENKLVVANAGNALVFRFAGGNLEAVEPEVESSNTALAITYKEMEITEKAQYVLLSNNIIDYLTIEDVTEILGTAISNRAATQKIIEKAAENGCKLDMTVIVMDLSPNRISDNPLPVAGAASIEDTQNPEGSDDYLKDDEVFKGSIGKKILAVLITVIVICLIIGGVYLVVSGKMGSLLDKFRGETTTVETTTEEEGTTVPETTARVTLTETETESETESETETEKETEKETTTRKPAYTNEVTEKPTERTNVYTPSTVTVPSTEPTEAPTEPAENPTEPSEVTDAPTQGEEPQSENPPTEPQAPPAVTEDPEIAG